jgi:arylsulfatase A-like enzyme/predicted negative regulator of RcsB-dependent stress response
MRQPLILLVTILFAACFAREQPRKPPIVLISVDTLRSDRLPIYGYKGVSTPHIDALRREGVLFQRAYSHAPLTLPAHASMFTGLLPTEHGVRNNIGYQLDDTRHRTLARVLRENGYRTGAAVSSYVLRAETGMANGFDVYDDDVPFRAAASTAENQRPGSLTLERARAFLRSANTAPPFLFFHIYEPHAPYTPPEPYRSRYADPYDGEIAASDAIVGELIAELKANGLYDDAVVLFTSDHGEALWEHGEDQHGILLYREVLQVPMVMKLPRSARAGTTVSEPFGLRDIFATLLAEAGVAGVKHKRTESVYSETLYPRIHLGWSELRSLIKGRHHYIESSSPELYDLDRDPGETRNLIAEERRVAAAMRTELAAIPNGAVALGPIDPEEARKLAALGYIGTPQERSGLLPNPREQIHVLRDLKSAFQHAAENRPEEAIVALRALLKTNPKLIDASTRLGEVLLASGRPREAADVYKAAMANAERFSTDLVMALAVAQRAAGQYVDALETLEHAGSAEGVDFARGDLYARTDRPEEAIAAYLRDIEKRPAHLPSYGNLAIVYMILGRKTEANATLEEMLRKNPGSEASALAARVRNP